MIILPKETEELFVNSIVRDFESFPMVSHQPEGVVSGSWQGFVNRTYSMHFYSVASNYVLRAAGNIYTECYDQFFWPETSFEYNSLFEFSQEGSGKIREAFIKRLYLNRGEAEREENENPVKKEKEPSDRMKMG